MDGKKDILLITGFFVLGLVVYNMIQKKRNQPPLFVRKKLLNNYNARTIPPFGIYLKESEKYNNELLKHELVHWRQYQEKGLINFYRDYFIEMKNHGYDKMPMEKEARKNETPFCQENYTYCVRTGKSNTIQNPKFRM